MITTVALKYAFRPRSCNAGLYSLVKRAPKAKKKRITFEVAGPAQSNVPLDARARSIFSYFKKYNYEVVNTGDVITFRGQYKASRGQAAAISFYVFVGEPHRATWSPAHISSLVYVFLQVSSSHESFLSALYCRLYRTCPGKSNKLDVSCYERAVLVARQPKKEFLCLGMCDVTCNIALATVCSYLGISLVPRSPRLAAAVCMHNYRFKGLPPSRHPGPTTGDLLSVRLPSFLFSVLLRSACSSSGEHCRTALPAHRRCPEHALTCVVVCNLQSNPVARSSYCLSAGTCALQQGPCHLDAPGLNRFQCHP